MPISYVEDITAEFYRLKGYFILKDFAYQVPKEITGKKVKGWKDIDVLALSESEVLIIECKAFTGYKKSDEMIKMLMEDFQYAESEIKKLPLVKNKRLRKVLVVDYSVKKVEKELQSKGIEIFLLENLMKDFIVTLKERIKSGCKEEHPMTRTLVFLIQRGFIT